MKKIFLLILVFIILFSFSGCGKEIEDTSSDIVAIDEESKGIEVTGIVQASKSKNIIIDFSALVEKVNVKEGQLIKKGEPLVTINFSEFEEMIKNKERELNINMLELIALKDEIIAERSELDDLTKKLDRKRKELSENTDPEIKKVLINLKSAQTTYEKALLELESKEKLYNLGIISKHELDEFKKTVDRDKDSMEEINQSIKSIKTVKQEEINALETTIGYKFASLGKESYANIEDVGKVKIKQENISILKSEIKSLKSKLEKSYIKDNFVISDFEEGIVYNIDCKSGDKFDYTSPPRRILSILEPNTLIVEANVPEEYIKDIVLGEEAVIIPYSDKSKQYKGKVVRIASIAVKSNGETTIPVEISIDENDGFLSVGFNVDVELNVKNYNE